MCDIEKWSIFNLLETKVLKSIKTAIVYGNHGNEAMFLTKNDDVFAFGSNISSCLGTGDTQSSLIPRKIEPLCGKQLTGFAYGSGPHVVAFSESTGEVYSWGHNGFLEVGNGTANQCSTPFLITSGLTGRKVAQVACGSHHTLLLTCDGEVYAWGQNSCGQLGSGMNNSNTGSPRKVAANIGNRKAIQIACGQAFSMAVMDNGEVFAWGLNGHGQLGLGHNVNQLNPCRLSGLQGVVVAKVECGYSHTLALSDLGVLYSWGANTHGQLGHGNMCNSSCNPVTVNPQFGRVVDIAATHYSNISAALTQNDKVYMWGLCKGQSVVSPTLTTFSNLHDVFACFSSPSVTWKPLKLDLKTGFHLSDSLRQAFDDPETCDLIISVESKEIRVHKAILKIRCEHFRTMFQGHWEENNLSVIEIEHFTYPVYKAFLQYLYTDEVTLSPEHALDLLVLANAYCESELKRRCEHIITRGITVENAATLYSNAIQYNAKELEEMCFRFSMNHMTGVVLSSGFKELCEETVKGFIHRAATEGAFKV